MNKKIVLFGALTLCITTVSLAMEKEQLDKKTFKEEFEKMLQKPADDRPWSEIDEEEWEILGDNDFEPSSQEKKENKNLSDTKRNRNNTIIPPAMLTTIRPDDKEELMKEKTSSSYIDPFEVMHKYTLAMEKARDELKKTPAKKILPSLKQWGGTFNSKPNKEVKKQVVCSETPPLKKPQKKKKGEEKLKKKWEDQKENGQHDYWIDE